MMREICAAKGVRYVQTSKLFYGEFSCSISIDIKEPYLAYNLAHKEARDRHSNTFRTLQKTSKELSKELSRIGTRYKRDRDALVAMHLANICDELPNEYEYRNGQLSLTIYMNDPDAVAAIVNKYAEHISKVVTPHHEKCVQFLRQNTDKIVRPSYYYNEYPFRVEFIRNSEAVVDQYVEQQYRLDEPETQGKKKEDQIDPEMACYSYGNYIRILYLKSFQDVILTKIALGGKIASIKEVVLDKDI